MGTNSNAGATVALGLAVICGLFVIHRRKCGKFAPFDPNVPIETRMLTVSTRNGGFKVSDLMYGCSPLAGVFQAIRDEVADEAVKTALELGYVDFDTAPHYGCGRSEERLGHGLAGRNDKEVRVWTKVGRIIKQQEDVEEGDVVEEENLAGHPSNIFPETSIDVAPVLDYTAEGVRKSHVGSSQRIEAPIYGLRVHDCEDEWRLNNTLASNGAIEGLVAMRKEGLIKHVSLGLNSPEFALKVLHAFPPGTIDSVMIANSWNLLDQTAGVLLAECVRLGVQVHNAGIFASGMLVGANKYRYDAPPTEISERTEAWGKLAAKYAVPLPVVAMTFAMAPQVVEKVAIGMKSAAEVKQSVAWLKGTSKVPLKLWADAKALGLLASWVPVPGQ